MTNARTNRYYLGEFMREVVEDQSYRLKPGDMSIINNREMHRPYFTSGVSYDLKA